MASTARRLRRTLAVEAPRYAATAITQENAGEPLSARFVDWYVEVLFPLAGATAVIAGLAWYPLFAITVGVDSPRLTRLVRRWAGALALCGFAVVAVPLLTQRFVTMLDLALLPLVSAAAYTIKWYHARRQMPLEPDEPRHN